MATFNQSSLNSGTGATLNLRDMQPAGTPKAIVQINHGMVEHAARYERFAGALSAAGYAVYVHDHRGHGATTAPDAPLGSFADKGGFQKVLGDISAVHDHIATRHAGLPVVVFGHSMGSILSLAFALQHPERLAALACWNSGVDTGALTFASRLILGTEALIRGRHAASKIAVKLTFDDWNGKFKPNRTACDWLSRDKAEVDAYVADPLCGFAPSAGMWLDTVEAVYFGADNARLSALPKALPVHLLGGGADPCSDKGQAMARLATRLRQAGLRDVTDVILPDTRHESLNEVNRDETTAAFLDWLSRRVT